jgi:DNA-binding MarR family transcriptional regulator
VAVSANRELADEIHRLIVSIATRTKLHEDTCMDRLSLSRMEAKALYRLEPGEVVSVRTLAERGLVDPSNLTAAVDTLEDRGLIQRESAKHDRRVRSLRLTPEGEKLRVRLVDELLAGHPGVAGLSRAEQTKLRDLLRRALA